MSALNIQEFSMMERMLLDSIFEYNKVKIYLNERPDALIELYTPAILGLRNLQYHKPFDWCCCSHEDKFYQIVALL